ncbi:hypothetical protein PIROE2DRAFT_7162 [Piromyces sp. E2]|nr:hypothetical protein PIROE2DRAFT_7162 [Piromyces sp. E2]|eukprot:OUM65747.1 hypothetical protein PIROE2DRAFT_7162 [Piromyces sp. E2]
MNDRGEYTLLGYIPRKRIGKIKRNIILVLIGSLVIVSTLYTTKKVFSDGANVKKVQSGYKIPKEISIDTFQPVNANNTNGPITINKELDDGTKINIFEKIIDIPDNKVENFLFDNETLSALPSRIDKDPRYLCESRYGLTEDVSNSYTLTCPLHYIIKIDKAFFGRYAKDKEHCSRDFKGDKINEDFLTTTFNCGKEVIDTVKGMCENKSSCDIEAGIGVFSDTCPRKQKYLHVEYHCEKNKENKIEHN